jgi:hypothetical protein
MQPSPSPEIKSGREMFIQFLESYLNIQFHGFQPGFGPIPDQILFAGPVVQMPGALQGKATTLSVPVSIMLLPQEQALAIIQGKREASARAFKGEN